MAGIIGKKIGMTSVFSVEGKNIPCTVIEAGPCVVTQVKTAETDGYEALQLAYGEKKDKHATKAEVGHFKRAGVSPKRKVVALKKGATETPDVVPPKPALQLAYVSKVDAFKKLIQAASTEPLYQPNEVELSVATLSALAAALEQLNARVSAARVVWSNALINRNNILYKQAQSMKATGRAVKRYVRAIFGHDSEQYAQLKALAFVKPTHV